MADYDNKPRGFQTVTDIEPLVLHLGPLSPKMNDQEFFMLCQVNPDLQIERTSKGDLIIIPPTGGETGRLNFILNGLFYTWVVSDGSGIGFDSSTGFTLPNGAKRSPDLSWVKRSRWEALSKEERMEFPPLCPDFVLEFRSYSDAMNKLHEKMLEYIENGAQLGWLIDPLEKRVLVFRPFVETETIKNHGVVSGDPILPGFLLDLSKLW